MTDNGFFPLLYLSFMTVSRVIFLNKGERASLENCQNLPHGNFRPVKPVFLLENRNRKA
jgi:hypothetical protein